MSFQLSSRGLRICLALPTPLLIILLLGMGAGIFYLLSKLK
ncbi:MAG: hypothetical protein WBA13_14785 [Microcoleaceae cyanobacterium]